MVAGNQVQTLRTRTALTLRPRLRLKPSMRNISLEIRIDWMEMERGRLVRVCRSLCNA